MQKLNVNWHNFTNILCYRKSVPKDFKNTVVKGNYLNWRDREYRLIYSCKLAYRRRRVSN